MKITHIGHSAFFIESESGNFLVDPFIKGNPQADFDVSNRKIDAIFVTHAHGDHLGDAIEISKTHKAPIVAVFELGEYCLTKGAMAIPAGIGGKIQLPFASAWFLPAIHSSSTPDGIYGGMPASLLVEIDGKKIFHAGDTGLTYDHKMIGEIHKIDIALLPIGGHFTMGIDEALIAAKWISAKTIIPMHYNTFPQIQANPLEFKQKAEAQGQKCVVLDSNETLAV